MTSAWAEAAVLWPLAVQILSVDEMGLGIKAIRPKSIMDMMKARTLFAPCPVKPFLVPSHSQHRRLHLKATIPQEVDIVGHLQSFCPHPLVACSPCAPLAGSLRRYMAIYTGAAL
jgi:hypothetical protein